MRRQASAERGSPAQGAGWCYRPAVVDVARKRATYAEYTAPRWPTRTSFGTPPRS